MLRTRKQLKSNKTNRRRLRVESLEGRRLLAADIGFAAGELEECTVIPESSDIPTMVCVQEDSAVLEVLPMDPVSLESFVESPELVQTGSLDTTDAIQESTSFDSIGDQSDEPLESDVVTMDISTDISTEASVIDAGANEAAAESSVAGEPRLSITASTFSWTFGEHAINAENFSLQLFDAFESGNAESTAIDVSAVDDVGETDNSVAIADDEIETSGASESAEQANEQSEETAEEEAEINVSETETNLDETRFQPLPEDPEVLPPCSEETTEELESTATPANQTAESTVAIAVMNESGDSETVSVETTVDMNLNIQVTVDVSEPAVGETESGESSESEAEPDSEAELTLDIIEEVLNDDGFVLVAFPADDLQAVLNGQIDDAFFDEIVLLEAPPETVSEETVENELPESPSEDTPESDGDLESENTETDESDLPELDPESPPVIAQEPLVDCVASEEEESEEQTEAVETEESDETVNGESGEIETAETEGELGGDGENETGENETGEAEGEIDAGGESDENCQIVGGEGENEGGPSETGGESDETVGGEVAETSAASTVSVVGELNGFVQIIVGDLSWSELNISADTLTITHPGSEMVFGGFAMVLMNRTSDEDSELAVVATDDATDFDSVLDSETNILSSDTYEEDFDDAICLWDPLEMCMDAIGGVLA